MENNPDQYQNGDSPADHLESLYGINAIGVVAITTTNNITPRAFHTGFVMSGFFSAGFHGIRWEGTL